MIYLADLEGNGIEIYRDRPMAEWDIHEDGKIIGPTESLDTVGILKSADREEDNYRLPNGTIVGHVHLSSKDANKSSKNISICI